MTVQICHGRFDPWQAVQDYQHATRNLAGKIGATSLFIGTMRDFNDGERIQAMTLEYYPGMTEKELHKIVAEAESQWSIEDLLVMHRVGDIVPNDVIVLVAVWASHRGDAFDACRYVMEALKSRAPFWKEERLASEQSRWVEKNSAGYGSAAKG